MGKLIVISKIVLLCTLRRIPHGLNISVLLLKDKRRTDENHERNSMDRHSRDRDGSSESKESREQMPPPNSRRTSTEPPDDKGNLQK